MHLPNIDKDHLFAPRTQQRNRERRSGAVEIDYRPQWSFEAAARQALADDEAGARGAAKLEEAFVQLVSPRLARDPS